MAALDCSANWRQASSRSQWPLFCSVCVCWCTRCEFVTAAIIIMLTERLFVCCCFVFFYRKSAMYWEELWTDCAQTTPLPVWAELTSGTSVCRCVCVCSCSRQIIPSLGTAAVLETRINTPVFCLTPWHSDRIKQSHVSVWQSACAGAEVRFELESEGGPSTPFTPLTLWVQFILIVVKAVNMTFRQFIRTQILYTILKMLYHNNCRLKQ